MCIRDSWGRYSKFFSGSKSNDSRNPKRSVSYTHLRAHETPEHLVCRLLLEKKIENMETEKRLKAELEFKRREKKEKKKQKRQQRKLKVKEEAGEKEECGGRAN